MAKARARGIRRHGAGWETYITVGGRRQQRTWALETPLDELQQWRRDQADLRRRARAETTARGGSFAADVTRYLARVAAMPTIKERAYHLELWLKALGRERARESLSADEIDAQLQRWRLAGLAPSTVRHRRTALLHLFTILDGRDSRNPVRATQVPKSPPEEARAIPYAVVDAILDQVRSAKARARLGLIAYCGLPQKQIRQLQPEAIDWLQQALQVTPRAKGAGAAGRELPLNERQVAALLAFHAAGAYGSFSTSSLRKAFLRACTRARKTGVAVPLGVRPYDLRHTFGATVYLVTKDLAQTARLLGHADVRTTSRYARAAFREVDRAAAVALEAEQAGRNVAEERGNRGSSEQIH